MKLTDLSVYMTTDSEMYANGSPQELKTFFKKWVCTN